MLLELNFRKTNCMDLNLKIIPLYGQHMCDGNRKLSKGRGFQSPHLS